MQTVGRVPYALGTMAAVDPKKMQAFSGGGGKGKGAPPPPEEEPMDEGEEPEAEEGDEQAMNEGGDSKFSPLMEMLEDNAEVIEEGILAMDLNALLSEDPLPEEQQAIMAAVLGAIDPKLLVAMRELLMEASLDEMMELGEHLAKEGHTTEPDLMGSFLFHAKEVIALMPEEKEGGDDEAPPDEERVSPVANMRR